MRAPYLHDDYPEHIPSVCGMTAPTCVITTANFDLFRQVLYVAISEWLADEEDLQIVSTRRSMSVCGMIHLDALVRRWLKPECIKALDAIAGGTGIRWTDENWNGSGTQDELFG